ncbi:unnamed protein product [Colias eurytheme]|nr:unnamed protein product [Colias eurytheme]
MENGMLLSNPDDIKEEWQQYFKTLLNCPVAGSPITEVIENNDTFINEISPIEVRKAISKLKNNKAPGADGIPGELWKYGEDITTSKMYELITKIWKEEKQPDEWNLGVICPVHKKGSRRKCSNYRGIAILPTAYKVLSYIILGRLEPYTEKILGDYQCGFRKNRSTTDQIFLLRQIMEKRWEYAQSLHILFVDFIKAYDSVDRDSLYNILRLFQIPEKLVRMVKVATETSKMKVKVCRGFTDVFEVTTGLKQGDALSPILFNLALEYLIRKILILEGGIELNGNHKVIGYADDLALLGQREQDLTLMAKTLESEGLKIGLKISGEKTEYLHMKRYKDTRVCRKNLVTGDTTYLGTDSFKYLGCTVTDTNRREAEIDIRIQNALRCSAALHKILVSKIVSVNVMHPLDPETGLIAAITLVRGLRFGALLHQDDSYDTSLYD